MSVVQVFTEDRLTMIGHLVGKETIGDQTHLGLKFVSVLIFKQNRFIRKQVLGGMQKHFKTNLLKQPALFRWYPEQNSVKFGVRRINSAH
jgi:hypothetical protein